MHLKLYFRPWDLEGEGATPQSYLVPFCFLLTFLNCFRLDTLGNRLRWRFIYRNILECGLRNNTFKEAGEAGLDRGWSELWCCCSRGFTHPTELWSEGKPSKCLTLRQGDWNLVPSSHPRWSVVECRLCLCFSRSALFSGVVSSLVVVIEMALDGVVVSGWFGFSDNLFLILYLCATSLLSFYFLIFLNIFVLVILC